MTTSTNGAAPHTPAPLPSAREIADRDRRDLADLVFEQLDAYRERITHLESGLTAERRAREQAERKLRDALGRLGDAESDIETLSERTGALEAAEPVESDAARTRREQNEEMDAKLLDTLRRLAAAGMPLALPAQLARNTGLDYRRIYDRLGVLEGRGLVRQVKENKQTASWAAVID